MHPPAPTATLRRWSQRQRYAFLEQRLFWEGAVSRAALMSRFDISAPQALQDFADYTERYPGTIEFDRSRKVYVATPSFLPRFIEPNARHYLTQLLLLSDDAIAPGESWLGFIPSHEAMPRLRRRLDVATLRPIVMGIHQRRAVEIYYQSMSSDEPSWRWIAPHSLAYDGARWHARAWCFNRSVFNDFVLARMLATGEQRPSSVDPALDGEWHEYFSLEIAPHPGLSPAQRQAVEMDYGMEKGLLDLRMRLALTQYFERHYGLDLPESSLTPQRRQIVLNNRDALIALRNRYRLTKEPD